MAKSMNLKEEASDLAEHLFKTDTQNCISFASRLLDICEKAQDKDILLIHNPGGWGTTPLEDLLQWEKSIVEGINASIDKLGYSCSLIQYFRTNKGQIAILGDIREQSCFFINKAKIMAAELEFLTRHFNKLQLVLIGVSQGAAFSNAVMQRLNNIGRIFSIEMGLPFPYKSRRVITKNTLALDSNGEMPDALMEWDIPIIIKTYITAPWRWIKYRLIGKPTKFTYCINVTGHDYSWDYPEVQRQIGDFLNTNFGNNTNAEVEV
ncbi:hypothetical protein ACFLVZ_00950 [Chloroflexota bacterium]